MTDIDTYRFSNGLKLVLENLPKSKSAGVAVGFPVGGHTEEAEVSGISHYLEHMIFKGTKSVSNVDATFHGFGAKNNAMTEVDATVYVAECPQKYALKTLELWLQLLSEASLGAEEFERERGVILSEYFISEDNPDYLVEKNATLTLFKGHPLSTTVIGSEETIKAISHSKMLDYFHSWYNPSNAVIWVSGDLTMDTLIECVKGHDEWTRHVKGQTFSRRPFSPQGPSATEIHHQIQLAQVGLALSGPTSSADERTSLQILGSMLSSGQSSILRRRLVLEGELTDKLRTLVSGYREAGMLFTTFATRPSRVPKVLTTLTKTVRELREDTAKFKEDFENARNHALGLLSTGIDSTMMWRILQGTWETLRRGQCSWNKLLSSLETLDFERFRDNVADIARPERVSLILAGDIKKDATKTVHW